MSEVTAKSYTLRTATNGWLGQVILTSDGMFSSVTDWGNFSYAWRSYGDRSFEDFILGLNADYFADKMYAGISYTAHGKKIQDSCKRFSDKILPTLQAEIKLQRENK